MADGRRDSVDRASIGRRSTAGARPVTGRPRAVAVHPRSPDLAPRASIIAGLRPGRVDPEVLAWLRRWSDARAEERIDAASIPWRRLRRMTPFWDGNPVRAGDSAFHSKSKNAVRRR